MEEKCHQTWERKSFLCTKKVGGYNKISKALHISQNTVAKVIQKFKKDGSATISQRRPGRPRKLTSRQEHLLMRSVEENHHASSLQLAEEVESQTGVTVSRDTIRRTLQRNGMHGYRPWRKPLLKPKHKKARLEFARAHAEKDEDYWDSILWSDETKITYALFQHDNDPKDTYKATAAFLKTNRVKVIEWPSMSPDLNPIKHLWGILRRQVEHHSPSSIQALKEVVLEEWKKIDVAICRQLVHSMPRRLGALLKNHGGHTKY